MNDRIRTLVQEIHEREEQLKEALYEQRTRAIFRIEGRVIRFEDKALAAHRKLKVGVFRWFRSSMVRNTASAPFIYAMIFPLLFLDLVLSVYHAVSFRLYRVPLVDRSKFIRIDRHHLGYLNSIEKLHCIYCGYANGLLAYAREITARTELYWCPIKHAHRVVNAHRHYARFLDFGEGEGYPQRLEKLREELRRGD